MLPFREITLEDKPMVEHCGSHYNYHLCERCFVDLFMWRSHYNTQICFKDGFMLVKMSPLDGGNDCYLAPVGQGDLGAALDALKQDAAERGLPFVIVSVASVCAFIFMNFAGLGSYSLALAFVVALFCFIPLVGSSLAMVSVALVGFAIDPTIGIATIIYFLIYQQFDAYVLYPNVMKRTVKVPGALVVLSAIIGGMLFGVIGAVIAIPTTAAVLLLYGEMVRPALDAS